MPIKLEDLTCEKCIYSADKGDKCRLHPPETHVLGLSAQSLTKQVEPTYWCGDGEWLVWWYSSDDSELLDIRFIDRKEMMLPHEGYYSWSEE